MLDAIKIIAAGLAGAVLCAAPAYLAGSWAGKRAAAVTSLETSVTILRDRGEIDAQISVSAAADLCGRLGLPDDAATRECMRRLAQADDAVGNRRLHHNE